MSVVNFLWRHEGYHFVVFVFGALLPIISDTNVGLFYFVYFCNWTEFYRSNSYVQTELNIVINLFIFQDYNIHVKENIYLPDDRKSVKFKVVS